MKCAACGGGNLVHEERDVDHRYGDSVMQICDLEADYCNDCGGFFMAEDEAERYVTATREHRFEVNRSIVDPGFLRSVCCKLNIDRREADKIFCVGHGAFAAFENGSAQVPYALVQLLMLLENHPELLVEITPPMRYPREEGRAVSFPLWR